ncbi:MAG: TIM barrel protein, partial [Deinococcota bacterium]|nr:TIM barrel protein [Deinococcota bacterium]
EDAALVHALSGVAPSVALHIPWDRVEDWAELRGFAESKGISLGAINPNLFQRDIYKLGSLTHPGAAVREEAVAHLLECCDIMRQTGSRDLSLWLADGTNYAGQDDIAARKERLEEGLARVYAALPEGGRLLLEYKPFEPAFYHTDLADWGMAYAHALKLGPRALVLVDLGHHLPGCNIEQIVAFLLSEGRLGGFHFNARRYADDDLIVGSQNPFELFCLYAELLKAERKGLPGAGEVATMIDQSHNVEPKLEAMLLSVINCQEAYARALGIDFGALEETQQEGDVLGAHRLLTDAFRHDVTPLLHTIRTEMGLDPEPLEALRRGGYGEGRAKARGTAATGGGYPTEE